MQDLNKAQLKKDEGFSLVEYPDTKKNPTIYWGHEIKKGEIFNNTLEEAERILDEDIADAEKEALTLFPEFETFTPNRQDALVTLAFNMGLAKIYYHFPRFVHNVNIGDFEQAGNELKYADGKSVLSKWYQEIHETRAEEIIGLIVSG